MLFTVILSNVYEEKDMVSFKFLSIKSLFFAITYCILLVSTCSLFPITAVLVFPYFTFLALFTYLGFVSDSIRALPYEPSANLMSFIDEPSLN